MALPVAFELTTITLSARSIVSVLTVVCVPDTVRSPDTTTSLKVTSEVVATGCPIDITPSL